MIYIKNTFVYTYNSNKSATAPVFRMSDYGND